MDTEKYFESRKKKCAYHIIKDTEETVAQDILRKYNISEYIQITSRLDFEFPECDELVLLISDDYVLTNVIQKASKLTIVGLNKNVSLYVNQNINFVNKYISIHEIKLIFSTGVRMSFDNNEQIDIRYCNFECSENFTSIWDSISSYLKLSTQYDLYFGGSALNIMMYNNTFDSVSLNIEKKDNDNPSKQKSGRNTIMISGSAKIGKVSQKSNSNYIEISGESHIEDIYQESENNSTVLSGGTFGNISQCITSNKNVDISSNTFVKYNNFSSSSINIKRNAYFENNNTSENTHLSLSNK